MRSIWKGAISFGLVTIPVKLYAATEQHDVRFHQVHAADGGRIRYQRVCTVCGNEVGYGDIAKGYELSSGEQVTLTDEDFADLPLSSSRQVDVLQFVPAEQVDPILFNRSYFAEPESAGAKPYVLLRDALERSAKVAIVKIALRQRESLGTLRVRDGVFVLETMLWPDEVREADFDFLGEDIDVRSQELKMATSLINEMTEDFDPGRYHDEYREALQAVIDAKVSGNEVVRPEASTQSGGGTADLMSALRASVAAAKKDRPQDASADDSAKSKPKPKSRAGSGSGSGSGGSRGKQPAKGTQPAQGKQPAQSKQPAQGKRKASGESARRTRKSA